MIPVSEWEWFGNAAHFICGRWCRFHMATKVGPWLISTVGEYVHPHHGAGSESAESAWVNKNFPGEDIGLNRKYETMVFRAGKRCEAPVCNCGLPTISGDDLDFKGYNRADDATKGHMELCIKWSQKEDTNEV